VQRYGYYRFGGPHWGMIILGVIACVAFVAVVAWIILTLLRQRDGHPHPHQPPPPGGSGGALKILEERFARGEIDEDEYRSRRDLLKGVE
jgi:putative membrane protein